LDDAQLSAFRKIQEWARLLASGRGGNENKEGNNTVWSEMLKLYPDSQQRISKGADSLTVGKDYGNMVSDNLVYVKVVPADVLTFRIGSLVYDGLDDQNCRTRLLCVTAQYKDNVIVSYRWGGRPYIFDELNPDGTKQHHWHSADEFAFLTLGAPIAQRIDEVPAGKCGEP
jgi:hypothetical protein